MSDEIKWFVGILFVAGSFIGGVIMRDRQMSTQIRADKDDVLRQIARLRETHVHKDELNQHLSRLSQDVRDLRDEIRDDRSAVTDRLDKIMQQTTNIRSP